MKRKTTTPLKTRIGKIGLRTWLRWIGLGIAALWLLAARDAGGDAVDRSADDRGAYGAAHWRLDSRQAISRALEFIPLKEISPDLQHAVIAAEDARFYTHHGFDWQAIEIDAARRYGRRADAWRLRRLRSSW